MIKKIIFYIRSNIYFLRLNTKFFFIKIKSIINNYEILIIKNIHGNKMIININDPGISRELLMDGTHEPQTTELIKTVLKPDMHIVEVGANVGYYTLIEAEIIGEGGRVYAIEPVPENYFFLQRNVNLNKYGNVSFFNFAISDQSGHHDFITTKQSNWGSMVNHDSDDKSSWVKERLSTIQSGTLKVETITFDEFIKVNNIEKINLVRMDIEGFEIQAIKGMKETIKKMKPPFYILMEVHNNVFKDPIKSLGPTFKFLAENNMQPLKIIAKEKTFDKPVDGDWIKLLLTENVIGVNHILLEKIS